MSVAGSNAGSNAASAAPSPAPDTTSNKRPKPPQETINEFWKKFTAKTPSKATTVIPQNNYTDIAAKKSNELPATTTQVAYEEAVATCKARVDKIIKECRRINKKYRDPHFDIEIDLKLDARDCLESLSNYKDADERPGASMQPQSVKRVGDIFDDPKFYIDGPTTSDVRQGRNGDCWLMAALCTLSNKPGLIEKLCVARDEAVGVYGFVFHRDGEWITSIVDDFLYLIKPDYDESFFDRILFEDVQQTNPEESYRKLYQSNSPSLYFAQCADPQETWLPLLEKAYAKAHGDYASIEGGYGGEGLEDLTGGISSELWASDILDKNEFWKELLQVNKEFLFCCWTGVWGRGWGERKGIYEAHAYSIQKAVEVDGKRLLRLKNPWGKGEWNGPWSDGSKEWTAYWLEKLDHRFGDDGDFWIEYSDLLRKYHSFERTRLFGPEWNVTQHWTTLTVPWTLDYHDTHFAFSIKKPGPVVIVLAQLDERYFRGLEGQYWYELTFRVHKAGEEDYIVRSQTPYRMKRSTNVELDLEAGDYEVRVKVNATKWDFLLPIEDVVRNNAKDRREKLTRMGLAYDLAHSKGRIIETPAEKAAREAHEKKEKLKKRGEVKTKILKLRDEGHYLKVKQWHRDQRKAEKKKQKKAAKAAEKKARKAAKLQEKEAKKAALKAAQEDEAKDKKEAEAKEEPQVKKEPGTEDEPIVKTEPGSDAKVTDVPEAPKEDKPATEVKTEATTETAPAPSEDKKEEPASTETTTDSDQSTPVLVSKSEDGTVATESEPKDAKTEQKDESTPVKEEEKTEAKTEEVVPVPEDQEKPAETEAEEESEEEDGDDVSSVGALSDLSEREIEIQIDGLIPSEETATPDPVEEDPDEFEKDPWNAVVVVGLRVYYKLETDEKPDEVIQMKVIRPNPYADEKDDKSKKEGKDCKTSGLDVDDSAKDATLEGKAPEGQKSATEEETKKE